MDCACIVDPDGKFHTCLMCEQTLYNIYYTAGLGRPEKGMFICLGNLKK